MDGVSGLEVGAKSIFPNALVQRCIVHLIRNSLKYVPSKDYKKYTQALRKVYGAPNLKAAQVPFENFRKEFSSYPGAIDVRERNFKHVEQLFDYGSDIRKVMYTTNAIEAIHSSFRKVTKKEHSQIRTPSSKYSIYEFVSYKISGKVERFITGQW
ncbi:transposase-like protein [Breznakia pachnodae]|uniref:Mutator family transposase n=1 Tax=Breznakia pachnodae TaxID=265178 RepID=A0ABU0E9D8_9FIRM|nr:transposase-like protein [Breznakia pachnodae]